MNWVREEEKFYAVLFCFPLVLAGIFGKTIAGYFCLGYGLLAFFVLDATIIYRAIKNKKLGW